MADIEGKNLRTLQHNGEYGNARVAILQHTLAAAQIGDVVVLGKLPGGVRIHTSTLRNAALGASSTLTLGYRYINAAEGSDATAGLLAATATSSAARTTGAVDVVDIATGSGVEIVSVVAGGAATGAISAIIEYDYPGQ